MGIAPLGVHARSITSGTPPATPVITGTADGGDGSSVVVSITGTDTIRLFYRILHASSWTTGLTRAASGDITQTGLSSGLTYEFYCVADDGNLVSAPSNVVTQVVSGTDASDNALGISPARILAQYIRDELATMTNPTDNDVWPLYVGSLSDSKNVKTEAGALYDPAGVIDGKLMNGEVIQHPGIQLRIRSQSYQTGWSKAESVALDLDEVYRDTVVVNGNTYLIQNISRTSQVIALGQEMKTSKRRYIFTVNFLMTLKRVA